MGCMISYSEDRVHIACPAVQIAGLRYRKLAEDCEEEVKQAACAL